MDSVILIKGLQLLLSLSILVILHEFGHFLPAKLFKTRVEKFFLFFDVKFALFKKKIGDTVYGIGWLPLGGYVKISGMVDESMDTENLKTAPQPWEFRSKPAWQRLIIMLGGIIVNIILAVVIYISLLAVYGKNRIDPDSIKYGIRVPSGMEQFGFRNGDRISSVDDAPIEPMEINKYLLLRNVEHVKVIHKNGTTETLKIPDTISSYLFKNNAMFSFRNIATVSKTLEGSPADHIGMQKNDRIIAINERPITFEDEASKAIKSSALNSLNISFVRGQDTVSKTIFLNEKKQLGVFFSPLDIKILNEDYSLGASIVGGLNYGLWSLHDYVKQLKFLFTKKGVKNIGGLGSIGGLFPSVWDWQQFWDRTALLSIILAVMNLLPIPALDGGHVVFLIYELITRRKPKEKILEYAQILGFVIIMTLMLYANGNDIYKFFIK